MKRARPTKTGCGVRSVPEGTEAPPSTPRLGGVNSPQFYIMVFQIRCRGYAWNHPYSVQLAWPHLFPSQSEALAAWTLAGGFSLLKGYHSEDYKVSAAPENARVWVTRMRNLHKDHEEFWLKEDSV